MKDDYYLMEPPPAERVEACPCCGSSARVWVYAEDPTKPVTRVVMCDHEGDIGPRDSLVYEGCLLQMPPDDFYRETGRDAVRYWNEYAKALTATQRANRWKTAQVLRKTPNVGGDASTNKMHPECLAMHQADADKYGDGEWEYSPYSHERPTAPLHCPKGDEPCIRGCKGWECRDGWPDAQTLKPDIAAIQKRMAEDPGFAAEVTGDRPPTPVGWSDTDWLKHLEEIRQDQETYHRGPLPETGWD